MGWWTQWFLGGNPGLHPELHLGDVGISAIFELRGGRGELQPIAVRNRPYGCRAAPGPSDARRRKLGWICAGEPGQGQLLELR